jgi:hypothetical protein
MAAIRWPMWRVQVPADVLFTAVPLVGAVNLAAAWRFPRAWWVLLPANALCGLVLGLFAAFQYESFAAGVTATFFGTIPSTCALFAQATRAPRR